MDHRDTMNTARRSRNPRSAAVSAEDQPQRPRIPASTRWNQRRPLGPTGCGWCSAHTAALREKSSRRARILQSCSTMVGHPSPWPAPRSCLTGRGRRIRYSLPRLRHELSQRLICSPGDRSAAFRPQKRPPPATVPNHPNASHDPPFGESEKRVRKFVRQ